MGNGITAWSYSRYADYQQCPALFKYKHIDRLPGPTSPAMERGSTIHKEGELYLSSGRQPRQPPKSYKHFHEEMKQLRKLKPMVEQQLGFTKFWRPTGWFGRDTWLRIVCDVMVRYDDNTVDLIDFKTGRKYDTNEEQVELFSTAPFMLWTEVNSVTTRLWYLDQPDDNEVIREYTRKEFHVIMRGWEKKIIPMFNDKKFAPTPNNKCGWCPYSKRKDGPCQF